MKVWNNNDRIIHVWNSIKHQIVATALHNYRVCTCHSVVYLKVARLFPLLLPRLYIPTCLHQYKLQCAVTRSRAADDEMTSFQFTVHFDSHYKTQRCIRGKEWFTSRCVEDGEWTELVLRRCKADKVSCNVAVTFALSKIAAAYSNRRLQAKQPLNCTLSTNDS